MGINKLPGANTPKGDDHKKRDTSDINKVKEKVRQSVHDTLNEKNKF